MGFVVFFEMEYLSVKKAVKRLMKNGVPIEERIQFQFSDEEIAKLTWIKPHEFKLNGRFYDVLERKKVNGKTVFHCIDDKKETQLFKNLSADTYYNLSHGNSDEPLQIWLDFLDDPRLSSNEHYQFKFDLRVEGLKRKSLFQREFSPLFGFPLTINLPPEFLA